MWGRLALPQRGQMLRAGASSCQAAARWLRLFDFDFFFLGTAIAPESFPCEPEEPTGTSVRVQPVPEIIERRPPGIAGLGPVAAVDLVAIDAALGAQAGAVGPAQ